MTLKLAIKVSISYINGHWLLHEKSLIINANNF